MDDQMNLAGKRVSREEADALLSEWDKLIAKTCLLLDCSASASVGYQDGIPYHASVEFYQTSSEASQKGRGGPKASW